MHAPDSPVKDWIQRTAFALKGFLDNGAMLQGPVFSGRSLIRSTVKQFSNPELCPRSSYLSPAPFIGSPQLRAEFMDPT